jgi:CheY-like chemotaxis protein
MLRLMRRIIGEDIDFSWQPGPGLWPVKVDPCQIEQVMANLWVNARDAITGVGRITIETGNVRIDADRFGDRPDVIPGDYVVLCVRDNGCGMDEETKSHLFEPFFTTKEVGRGTGPGLATVYGIVMQKNGFIHVQSELGAGTTFRIHLQRHSGAPEKAETPKVQPIRESHGETILVVEDEVLVLNLTHAILESLGYRVLAASNPAEAERQVRDHQDRIDLLITDVVMPEMNGRDLTRRLQGLRPDLKVLYMSGYTANVIAHCDVLDTGVHFIQKPFRRDELAETVCEVLAQ